jgi:DNA polymerase III subunit delta'
MAFHDIAGNGRVKTILRMALGRARVPNSLLFCGPRGVGKRKTARVLAQALNCLNLKDDACGECAPCRTIAKGAEAKERGGFPDVFEIDIGKEIVTKERKNRQEGANGKEEDADIDKKEASKEKTVVSIDQMRELRHMAYLRPMIGRRRVFIVDDADSMSEPAANAILKVLEEPPSFTHIVLLSENPALILPTIKSRCQILTFLPVSDAEVEKALRGKGVEAEKARIIALICRGNMEKALESDWEDIQAERRDAWGLFQALAGGGDPAVLIRRFGFPRGGTKRDKIKGELLAALELLAAFGRDVALLGEGGDPRYLINPDFEAELRSCAGILKPRRALAFIGLLSGAAASLDRNGHIGALTASLSAQWLRVVDAG